MSIIIVVYTVQFISCELKIYLKNVKGFFDIGFLWRN